MHTSKAVLILTLLFSTFSYGVELPDAPKPTFHKNIFVSEVAAYTVSNIMDGYATVHDTHIGINEASFPTGSAELLGTRPGVGRYLAVYGTMEVGEVFAAYKLEHSDNKALRLLGHGLLVQGTYMHFDGFGICVTNKKWK